MVNKNNIIEIINDHQREIDELKITHTPHARHALENRISFLQDNMYRYKLQSRAWGIDV